MQKDKPDGAASHDDIVRPAALSMLPAEQGYAGKSLEQWAIEYMHWYYAWTSDDCVSAESDPDGSDCSLNQDPNSHVFFFASCDDSDLRSTVTKRTRCKVPAGKALMVPISFVSDDDATSDTTRPAKEIEENAAAIKDSMRELLLVADGQRIENLAAYALGPSVFEYNLPEEPNWYTCNGFKRVGSQTVNPSYLVGYFALFEPPARGPHELEYASVQTYYNSDYFFHVDSQFVVE